MQRALLLAPMDLGESLSHLRHHLALVERTDPLFADDAVARLHRVANGLHRQAQQRRPTEAQRRRCYGWLTPRPVHFSCPCLCIIRDHLQRPGI